MQRLFVAVVPPPAAVEHLAGALAAGRGETVDGLRWTPPEHWHVTLAFLPAVPPAVVPDLATRLARAASRCSVESARLVGAGAFPRAARATVLWTGVRTDGEQLGRLATRCRAAARRLGLETPGGPFRAHLTLARLSRPGDVGRLVEGLSGYVGPSWPVSHVRLVASYLGQGPAGRPRYDTLAELPLSS